MLLSLRIYVQSTRISKNNSPFEIGQNAILRTSPLFKLEAYCLQRDAGLFIQMSADSPCFRGMPLDRFF
jgi:hypothetical protein